MTVQDLNRKQLTELKLSYYSALVCEGIFAEIMNVDIDEPSYEMMANVDKYVSDEFIYNYYDGIIFSEEDFLIK